MPDCPSSPSSPPRSEADHVQGNASPSPAQQQLCKSEDYRKLFHLPAEEVFVQDFNCAFQKKILLQGHMYLFEQYICFYSNIFGYEKKKVLPLRDVAVVRKGWTAGLFPNAIEIGVWGKKYFFASFLSRDEAYRLIVNGWSRHSGHARTLSETSLVGTQSAPDLQVSALQSNSNCKTSEILEVSPSPATEESEEKQVLPKPEKILEPSDSLLKNDSQLEGVAPPLPSEFKTVMESEFPVDVEDFFELFFSNNASAFAQAFHRRCGDEDFRCTQWSSHPSFGSVRDISFRHPINLYFGPKSAMCNETQKVRFYRNNHLVIETSQQMADIPYADYFHVEVRWDITRVPKDVCFHSFVRISMHVDFSKRTFWRGKIEQTTLDECKETYSIWVQEAYNVLSSKASANEAVSPTDATLASDDEELVEPRGDIYQSHNQHIITTSKLRDLWEFEVAAVVARATRKCRKHLADCVSKNPILLLVFVIALLAMLTQIATLVIFSQKQPVASLQTVGRCMGGSNTGTESIAWLEQRARFVREELAITEARLQSMHQDLSMLKVHMSLFDRLSNNPLKKQ